MTTGYNLSKVFTRLEGGGGGVVVGVAIIPLIVFSVPKIQIFVYPNLHQESSYQAGFVCHFPNHKEALEPCSN